MNLDTASWARLLSEVVTQRVATDSLVMPAHDFTNDPERPHRWDEWATDEWSAEQAFHRLGIRLAPFPADRRLTLMNGQLAILEGLAYPNGDIALNGMAANKVRTVVHEIAHILFEHPQTPVRGDDREGAVAVREFEAESTAMLVSFALGEGDRSLDVSRHYIQQYLETPTFGPLPRTWEKIMRTAQRILAAGACKRVKPNRDNDRRKHDRRFEQFAAKVRW